MQKYWRTLRAAIRWGRRRRRPLIDKSPFHRFGRSAEHQGGNGSRSADSREEESGSSMRRWP